MSENIERSGLGIPVVWSGWGAQYINSVQDYKHVRGHFLDAKRMKACTLSNLSPFYDKLHSILFNEDGSMKYKLCNIWNLDETNQQINGKKEKVAEFKETQQCIREEAARMLNTTITFCVNAEGYPLVSQIIHKGVKIPEEYKDFKRGDFIVYTTGSGWQEIPSFNHYMRYFIVPGMLKDRKKGDRSLLMLDGHGSRINPELWLWVMSQGIDVVFLPAHSSTKTQVLECGVNSKFKSRLKHYFTFPNPPNASQTRTSLLCVNVVAYKLRFIIFLIHLFILQTSESRLRKRDRKRSRSR